MIAERRWGWGLIGPGRFAREFAEELSDAAGARLRAVASRSPERASAFAAEFGFECAYASYEELVADPEIDVVYVVVPHVFHQEVTELALRAGKAVLCEKPLTPSAQETRVLTETAAQSGCFLMEAMKTGFLPAIRRAREWIGEGRIGEPLLAEADFCFRGPDDPEDRLMNPALAGGAVLDVGIYPLYLCRHLLGEVIELEAFGHLAPTGVEDSAAILTRHGGGVAAVLTCSFRTEEAMDAVIRGSGGEIRLPRFHAAKECILRRGEEEIERFVDGKSGMLGAEIEAVHDALDRGLIESPGHSHADSIRLAELMDQVRSAVLTGR